MNFRFFEDLVGSAPEAAQEFRFREIKHSAKNYSITQQRLLKIVLENLHKILKISKKFQNISVKFKKN